MTFEGGKSKITLKGLCNSVQNVFCKSVVLANTSNARYPLLQSRENRLLEGQHDGDVMLEAVSEGPAPGHRSLF